MMSLVMLTSIYVAKVVFASFQCEVTIFPLFSLEASHQVQLTPVGVGGRNLDPPPGGNNCFYLLIVMYQCINLFSDFCTEITLDFELSVNWYYRFIN